VLKQLRILQSFVQRDAVMLDAEVKMAEDYPLVVMGKRSRAAHKKAAQSDRKLSEAKREKIKAFYEKRVREGKKRGAIKALEYDDKLDVGRTTIGKVIRKNNR
jgi:hypothetical protein